MVFRACGKGWDVTAWLSQALVLRLPDLYSGLPEVLLQQILQGGPARWGEPWGAPTITARMFG